MTEPLLQVMNVTQRFGGLDALSEVTMTVVPNEIHGLIGPNGAGKTTLLDVLTGIYDPTEGDVRLGGDDITGRRPDLIYASGIARTFQNIRIWPTMTLRDNVMVGAYQSARIRPWDIFLRPWYARRQSGHMRSRAMDALEAFGLETFADQLAGGLSYGRRRLLEMARASVTSPKLLLLDEPVAGLNPAEVGELQDRIRGLRARGMAVLLIEHNMRFVMSLCDRVTVLNFGRRLATGTPSEIQENPHVIDAYLGQSEPDAS